MRFPVACALLLFAVRALDQDLGHGHHHWERSLEVPESHASQASQTPVAKYAIPAERKENKGPQAKPGTEDHPKAAKKEKQTTAAEVNAKGHFRRHEAAKKHPPVHRLHPSELENSLVEVEVPRTRDPGFPVTFFQEESEQGPFHQVRERVVHEKDGSGLEIEVAKLSDAPEEDSENGEEEVEGESEDADDITLPKASDEIEDDAAVADVLSASPSSMMRREAHDGASQELAAAAAKRWLGLETFRHGKVDGQRHLRKVVLVFLFLGLAAAFMLVALTKADTVIKSVLSHVSLSTEPTGSELQEPTEKKDPGAAAAQKTLANLVESSLGPCATSRKPSKEVKDFGSDPGSSGGLRSRIEALPVSEAAQVERLLPSAGGYDVNFSKPLSSRQLLRLEAVVQSPQGASEPLLAPLTRRPCVLYTANASRKVHGGMPLPVAFASQHTDFKVTLCGLPRVEIRVPGSEVNLFASKTCDFAEVLPFPCAPDHWQDFVSAHLSAAGTGSGTGSSENHALENELRAKGTAVEFHECCLVTGTMVTLIGELMRAANGELTLQPLSQEQVSWKRHCWQNSLGAEADDLELLEARSHVLISDDPTLLTLEVSEQAD